jgi:sulfonate transport system substrate-binding protein
MRGQDGVFIKDAGRRMRFLSIGWAALAVATAFNVAMPAVAKETPPAVIHIGGQGNPAGKPYGTAVIGVLRAKNYLEDEFKAEGVKIEWQFPRGTGPAINEAIASGQLDFANYGGLPNIVGKGAGLPTKVLASYGSTPNYLLVRKGSGITKLQDLKGKKVTVSRGTINELALNTMLSQARLGLNDVQLFDLKAADQITALTSGDVDAVVGNYTLLVLPARGIGQVIYSTKGRIDPANAFGSFVVTASFAMKYPETTQRVVNAFVRAANYASQEANREDLFKIWELTGAPRKDLSDDYDGDKLADRLSPLLDGFYVDNIKRGIVFAQEQKLIRRPIKIDEWLDASYLKKAIKDQKLEGVWTPRDAAGKAQQP